MRGARRAAITIAGAACLLALAAQAWASEVESVEYEAASGCPDRGAFLEAAARKLPRVKDGLAQAGPFKIEVKATADGYSGVLQRRDAAAITPASRVLFATRCQDVVEALALTLALSLVPAPEPPAVVAAAPPPPSSGKRGRLTLGAGVQAGRFVAGDSMLGATVAVGFAPAGRADARWSLGPEGRLRFAWSRNDVVLGAERARFGLMSAALELCPLHLQVGRTRLGMCGLFEGGALDGEGIGVAHPQRARSTWLSLGGGPELEVALTRSWRLVATAFAARPLRQTRFVFAQPDLPVARTAEVALSGALALVVHFP